MKARKAQETLAQTSKIVLPNDTNVLGNLMGGQLLNWMDITAGISAQRHSQRVVVTASVNNVSFNHPIKPGGKRKKCNEAIYTFVAVDQNGSPIEVPELIPETKEEKERYDAALRRRQLSLILAGKMKPESATELKAIFEHVENAAEK